MSDVRPRNGDMNETVGETKVDGHVIPVGRGGEAIVFEIPMGFFKIVCIANIPSEGEDKAPVYVKLKVSTAAFKKAQFSSSRRHTRPETEQVEHEEPGDDHGNRAPQDEDESDPHENVNM